MRNSDSEVLFVKWAVSMEPEEIKCDLKTWVFHFAENPFVRFLFKIALNFFHTILLISEVDNCIAKWRLGVQDFQELPLLEASS